MIEVMAGRCICQTAHSGIVDERRQKDLQLDVRDTISQCGRQSYTKCHSGQVHSFG